jgi:hypothetical protein
MKNYMSRLLFATMLAAPLSSFALVEARLSYGSLASSQNMADICQGSCATPSDAPAIVPTFGAGLDVIVTLPLIPFGFGVRTESMKLSASNSAIEADIQYNRTALIVNYRLIDTIVHFGPIATVGMSHSGSMNIKEGGNTVVDVSPGSLSSYSLGLELLVKPLVVLPLTIGAEAGYMSFKWGDVTNSVDSTQKSIDLSGTYLKAFIGLDF